MTDNCKVTVLLSVFNGEKYLDRCLESLFNQTYSCFNILCIDDGSTDSTLKKLKTWKYKFKPGRMKYISNHLNQGLTKCLNVGLKMINTTYTARIDSDDWWEPDKLEKQLKYLKSNPGYGVIGCNYTNLRNSKQIKVVLPESDYQIKQRIIIKNPFAHSCVVFDTLLVKKLGGYDSDIRYGQDYDLWLRCFPQTKFHNLQEFLCHRSIGSGISVSHQKEQMLQCMKTQIRYIRLYNLSPLNYIYLIEPLALVIKNLL